MRLQMNRRTANAVAKLSNVAARSKSLSLRKLTAKEPYANGSFADVIPKEGILTVFYENDVALVRRLLL